MTLDSAGARRPVRVTAYDLDSETAQRVAELGLHRGAHITVLSPCGQDPLLVAVKDGRIALNRTIAAGVQVEHLGPALRRPAQWWRRGGRR